MFKLVALFALIAAAAASPGAIIAPLGYSANVVAPAATVVSSLPSSLAYSSPIIASPLSYSAPWSFPHLIKKRSLAVSSYIAPTSYIASAPFAATYAAAAPLTTTYAAPLVAPFSAPVYTAAAHLIKKRQAPFILPSTYVAPAAYATPLLTSTYAAASPIAPLVSSPYYAAPLAHLIKKRSAPLAVTTYSAPSFSHTSRFDFQAASPAIAYNSFGAAPLAYSHSLPIAHVL